MDTWTKCGHCGFIHDGVCPRIKSIEYYENGMIKKVEYHGLNEPERRYYDDEDASQEAAMPF
jgi:hypothetical protein